MYEDYSKKRKIKINWKSLLFKLVILLVVVFLVMLLISIVKKGNNKKVESNFKTNFSYMQTTAKDYFKGSKLPENINGRKKVTLGELIKENAIVEFKDQNNKACDMVESFIEATKISDTEYSIKVKLTCGVESDYVIDNITVEVEEEKKDNTEEENNNSTTDNNNSNQSTNKPTSNKPNTNKPSTSKPTNGNINYINTDKKPSTGTEVKTCSYGDKTYNTNNVVAYFIPGDCAVAISEYHNGNYANNASSIGSSEYSKLYAEMAELQNKTGVGLEVEAPSYSAVYNSAGTGLVGYKILFTVRNKNNKSVVYEYYLDSNKNRKAVIDIRSSLNNSNNNSNITTEISMNINRLYLDIGESYKLNVMLFPNYAASKNIIWSSTDSNIVSVDNNGNIIAKKAGSAKIIATVGDKSTSSFIVVKESN